MSGEPPLKALSDAAGFFADGLNADVSAAVPIAVGRRAGLDVVEKVGSAHWCQRFVIVDERMYDLTGVAKTGTSCPADMAAFVGSFTLTPP
ncbi:MAG: hypothetical protein ACXWMN_04345 [Candidatus Limnocylindria bacterium]